jgi:polyhydroxyalkanoate synthesis regulator protein
MFAPFARQGGQAAANVEPDKAPKAPGDIDELKRQIEEMQKRLDRLGNKDQ